MDLEIVNTRVDRKRQLQLIDDALLEGMDTPLPSTNKKRSKMSLPLASTTGALDVMASKSMADIVQVRKCRCFPPP